jgi:curved DNA-binding protein CbpA
MSPEQVLGGALDGRSDLFSVGCMLCELVSGRRPFEGDSVMTTLYKIAHDEPTLEHLTGPELEGLLPILKRALAKKVDDRFATAAELGDALKGFLNKSAARVALFAAAPAMATGPRLSDATLDLKPSVAAPTLEVARPQPDPTQLFRLLREIYVGSRSGHLFFTHGSERRSLRILRGQVIHASCDVPGEHLGDVAVRYGLLSQADLERAVAIVLRDRKRLGIVLSELGLLDRSHLEEAVGLHVREILFNVLERSGGVHAFEDVAEGDLEAELGSTLSTGELILEATRRVQDPALVRRGLGDMDRILELSTDPLLRAQKIALTPTDGFVLSRIDGATSARDIIGLIPLPSEDTERSLLGLLCTGSVDYRPEPTRSRPALSGSFAARLASLAEAEAAGAKAVSSPRPAIQEPRGEERALPDPGSGPLRQLILGTFEGLRTKDHFEVLGLTPIASEGLVRDAYSRLARALHPDTCRDTSLSDLREKRDAVFVRVCEAYETLRSPDTRAEYQRQLEMRKPRRFPPAHQDPRPSPGPAPAPAAPAPTPMAQAAPTAPSRAPEVAAQSDDPSADFQEPSEVIRYAERLMQADRYWDAIQQLEKLIPRIQGPIRHRAQVTLARASMKNPKWLKRADELLQSVIRENPGFVEAYVALGTLYREGKLVNRASAMYRKALGLDPNHPEARQQLAALDEATAAPRRVGALKGLFS